MMCFALQVGHRDVGAIVLLVGLQHISSLCLPTGLRNTLRSLNHKHVEEKE